MPQFYRPQSSWGGAWGKRAPLQSGRTLPATLARLLMQLHGSSQVSPQSALGNESVRARAHTSGVQAAVCFAGVAHLVEHLFCKQVVAGSSPTASSAQSAPGSTGGHARAVRVLASASSLARAASLTSRETSESCPSGQREQAVNLPAYAYAGSNPALSTSARLRRASVSISVLGLSAPPPPN